MDKASNPLLSSASLTRNEDADFGGGHPLKGFFEADQGRGASLQFHRVGIVVGPGERFLFQGADLQSIAQRDEQSIQVQWFGDKVKGPQFGGFHRGLNRSVGRNHNNR